MLTERKTYDFKIIKVVKITCITQTVQLAEECPTEEECPTFFKTGDFWEITIKIYHTFDKPMHIRESVQDEKLREVLASIGEKELKIGSEGKVSAKILKGEYTYSTVLGAEWIPASLKEDL